MVNRLFAIVLTGLLVALVGLASVPAWAKQKEVASKIRDAGAELVRGNFERSIALYTEALSEPDLANERKATILNDRGVAQWRLRKAPEAIEDFNAAVSLYPEYAAIYNNRGNVLLGIGMLKEAIRDFDRAILLAPKYSAAYNNRAMAHVRLNEHNEAVQDFTDAIRLAPSSPVPHNGRGLAHLSLSRPHAALRDFTRTLSLDTKYAAGYRSRARVYLALSRYDQAIGDMTRAISFKSDDAQMYLTRAQAFRRKRRFKSALKDLDRAIELNPSLAPAYSERGLVLAMLQAFEPAFENLGRALDLDHRSATTYANRAWAFEANGDRISALPDVTRALKLNAANTRALGVRARDHEANGRNDKAALDYRKVVSLAPRDQEAWEALERLTGEVRPAPTTIGTSEFGDWSILRYGDGRYVARSHQFRRIEVPLETYGGSKPRLLEWEMKNNLYRGIGILRYYAGKLKGASKTEIVEYAAIVDINRRRVVALEPYRIGKRLSGWAWQEGRLVVSGADGITTEYRLRKPRRRSSPNVAGSPFGGQGYWGYKRRPVERRRVRKRRRKKSLFELLFN